MRAPSAETNESLSELLDDIAIELGRAKKELDANDVSPRGSIEALKNKLDDIYRSIMLQGFSEDQGIDSEHQLAYVIMQGIIERAQATALDWVHINAASAFMVTPFMPTPLMLSDGIKLRAVELSNPQSIEKYRNNTILKFLEKGGIMHSVYSHDAKTELASYTTSLANYAIYMEKYENLKDYPVIKINMADFPESIIGTMYRVDDFPIVTETKQITQADNITTTTWAIRIGDSAEARAAEIKQFLEENGAAGLGR